MKESFPTVDTIREYLLGRLDDQFETEDKLSQQVLFNDELSEIVDSIEEEIIEDYLDGALDAADKKAVEEYFLRPAERREKLRFARDLRDGFERRHNLHFPADSQTRSTPVHAPPHGRVHYRTYAGLAALVLFIVSSVVYITRVRHGLQSQIEAGRHAQTQLEDQLAQERQHSTDLARRLEQYEPPVALLTFIGLYRDTSIPVVEIKPFTQRIRVEIGLQGASATAYDVQLQTQAGEQLWSEPGVRPSSGGLRFEIPVQRITTGVYCVVAGPHTKYCFHAKLSP